MKLILVCTVSLLVAFVGWNCSRDSTLPVQADDGASKTGTPSGGDPHANGALCNTDRNFVANLSGGNETPPNNSPGHGVAEFQLNQAGDTISYTLTVSDIKNVVAAHIHVGPPGVAGPVIVPLFSGTPGGGSFSGQIAQGQFAASDLVGPMAGSVDFGLFIEKLHKDSLYVNVHTDDGVDSNGTGIGDLPAGEIRGQLEVKAQGDDDDHGHGHDEDKDHGHGHDKDKDKGHGHGNGHDGDDDQGNGHKHGHHH